MEKLIATEQKRNYATKQTGKTKVDPFWNMEDIMGVIDYFKQKEDWNSYLITILGLLLGRRIGDTVSLKWSDFYAPNGKRKREIRTIEEQKTSKITIIPVSQMVWESIDYYLEKTNKNPMENLNDYIFDSVSMSNWVNKKYDNVYELDSVNEWCLHFKKDLSMKRKEKILEDFNKQKKYKSMGEYLYYSVDYMDAVNTHVDNFRKKFKKACDYVGVEYPVSCHSLRKTFGYISRLIHPDDPNSILILQDIFNHTDQQVTMRYIGLSDERKRQYFEDMGDVVRKLNQGDAELKINNSPIISIKTSDLRKVLIQAIGNQENSTEILNDCLNLIDELKNDYK